MSKLLKISTTLVVVIAMAACGGNSSSESNSSSPTSTSRTEVLQTPDNNPEVLAKTFVKYMQNNDYEDAIALFAKFNEESITPLEVSYKVQELAYFNLFSMSNSPARIEVIDNNGTTCSIRLLVDIHSSSMDSYLYLKKVNDCWRIDEYSLSER